METGLVNQSTFIAGEAGRGAAMAADARKGSVPAPALAGSGLGRAEYLLVVYPHGDLQDRLLEEQQQFSAEYSLHVTVRNRPHITLAAFQAGELMEDTLIRWIQRICLRFKSFDLTLNNYSGIPPHTTRPPEADSRIPGTIYLRVQDPEPFRELMTQLKAVDEYIRSSGCPPIHLITRPYLSIAGGLTEQVYNKAMPDYSRRTFHDSFRIDELVLLKRAHSFDACKTVNIFRLLPDTADGSPTWALPHL
jgi:2'-5' RNA ligase superfamily protein